MMHDAGLETYGPLGAFCLVLIAAIGYLWRAGVAERRENLQRLIELQDSYRNELRDLAKQKVELSEKWIEKYSEFAKLASEVLDKAVENKKR